MVKLNILMKHYVKKQVLLFMRKGANKMNSKIKIFLLCFSILGILLTSLPTLNYDVKAKEVQQSQVAQEVNENKIEDIPTLKETPIENIGGELQYVEQIENINLTRGSPAVTSTRVLDYDTGEYIYVVGYNAITLQSNGLNYSRLLTEILLNNDLAFCIELLILAEVGISYKVTSTDNDFNIYR